MSAANHPLRKVKAAVLPDKYVFSTDLFFEPSKDRLTPEGEAQLKAIVPALRSFGHHPIYVVAHSDRLGFETYNSELTERLALRVKAWLVGHGVAKAEAITAKGVGSAQPLAAENMPHGRDDSAGRARNRRIEISIDPDSEIETESPAEKVATKVSGNPNNNEMTKMLLPPELQDGLVDSSSTMRPAGIEDLTPDFVPPEGQDGDKGHKTSTTEWGGGGTDFGNHTNNFSGVGGGGGGTFGGQPVDYNADGKRVVKITPTAEKLEAKRKETVEAQNEFGLWRDP